MSTDLINLRAKIDNIISEGVSGNMNALIVSYLDARVNDGDRHEEVIDSLQDGRFSDAFFNEFIYKVTPWANETPEALKSHLDAALAKLSPAEAKFMAVGQKPKKPKTLDEWLAGLTDQHPKKREADYAYRMLQLAMDRSNASAEETWRTNLRRLGAPV